MELEIEENSDFYTEKEKMKTHELCATIFRFSMKIKGFINLTGTIPHKSSRGNLYVVFMYDYDSNSILTKPIKKSR